MRLPFRKPAPLDPATGRPFGDHGTADDAVAFVLDNPGGDIEADSFLRYWDIGDLRAWPEYYSWLAARERARPTPSLKERVAAANRITQVGVIAMMASLVWLTLGGPVWAFPIALLIWWGCAIFSEQPPRVARTETIAR